MAYAKLLLPVCSHALVKRAIGAEVDDVSATFDYNNGITCGK
jgi:hypothetical protein